MGSERDRTRLFARYSFIGSIMAAVGALGAALPEAAAELWGVELRPALQAALTAASAASAGDSLDSSKLADAGRDVRVAQHGDTGDGGCDLFE